MIIRTRTLYPAAVAIVAACIVLPAAAQKKQSIVKRTPAAVTSPKKTASPEPSPMPVKRNERPPSDDGDARVERSRRSQASERTNPVFRYEFSQPDFAVTRIVIEHDEQGNGTISFTKHGDDEAITDPISISAKALTRINDALAALNFLDSRESYQHEKDFSNMGNIRFALSRGGKTREVAYNYTANKDAKVLMDEYRKIGNQFIWIFDIKLSRENQPLESPRLMDALDSLVQRKEISDPFQLEPFLRELSDDESIPLIARNHAGRLVKQFEKERAKELKKRSGSNN